jgi:hypothetical protein
MKERGRVRRPPSELISALLLLLVLVLSQPSTAAPAAVGLHDESPLKSGVAEPAGGKTDFKGIAALITAFAALLTSGAGFVALIRKGGRIEQNVARQVAATTQQAEVRAVNAVQSMLDDFAKLEAGMRNVLTKVPESESIWMVISNRIADDKKVRQSITDAVLLEIVFSRRTNLKGLIEDPSVVGGEETPTG